MVWTDWASAVRDFLFYKYRSIIKLMNKTRRTNPLRFFAITLSWLWIHWLCQFLKQVALTEDKPILCSCTMYEKFGDAYLNSSSFSALSLSKWLFDVKQEIK